MEFKSIEEKAKYFLKKIETEDRGREGINSFLEINKELLKEARELDRKKGKKGKLYGKIIGVKSNINVIGLKASCASKTLEDYKAGYDATVIKKIKAEDGLILGMLNMDEFACGSAGDSGAFGATKNPMARDRIAGGSSGGSAAAVSAGFCDMSLGSDTGGSIRNPASHCGVVGMKPSYGAVSRYGLIDLSMSLDQIGPIGKTVGDCNLLFQVIAGKDEKDTQSRETEKKGIGNGKIKIGVVNVSGVDLKINGLVWERIEEIKKKLKWDVKEVEIEHLELGVQTYYPLVYVEFFSGTRRMDGRRYGKKIEESCGKEVLRRILGGSEISKAEFSGRYYKKALEVKELIAEEFAEVFKKVDCLIVPTSPVLPWKTGETGKMKIEEIYAADALTCPANLAGICAISIPAGEISGVPVGMQIMCGKGEDEKMLWIAERIEGLNG